MKAIIDRAREIYLHPVSQAAIASGRVLRQDQWLFSVHLAWRERRTEKAAKIAREEFQRDLFFIRRKREISRQQFRDRLRSAPVFTETRIKAGNAETRDEIRFPVEYHKPKKAS